MTTFKELCDYKMSKALRAMVDGLVQQSERDDFVIDMGAWLNVKDGVCYGCAAACAVQRLTGANYAASQFGARKKLAHADAAGWMDIHLSERLALLPDDFNASDLDLFELAIDRARLGYLMFLADYLACLDAFCEAGGDDKFSHRFSCTAVADWKSQREEIESVIRDLEAVGL